MVEGVRIARGIEFQMTGAAERKEREPKLLLDGLGTIKCWSEERRERTDWWKRMCEARYWGEFVQRAINVMVASLKRILLWTGSQWSSVEEVRSGLDCRTGEQFWRESFELVGVCVWHMRCAIENRIAIVVMEAYRMLFRLRPTINTYYDNSLFNLQHNLLN